MSCDAVLPVQQNQAFQWHLLVGCVQPTIVAEPRLPSVRSVVMALFACCRCTRKGLVSVLLKRQSGAVDGF